ncbi:hypothetical protein BS47DRAFT_1274895, partial [Hydnum rufescens UP504]
QAKLPEGATLQAIVIASDETHLTNYSGDKTMHAVYITLGNIHSDVRRKPTFGAWMLLAKLPTSRFANTTFDSSGTKAEALCMPGILKQQLFHESLKIVLAPLSVSHRHLTKALGPDGYMRHTFPVLMGWIADLKEQLVIAGVTQYACP